MRYLLDEGVQAVGHAVCLFVNELVAGDLGRSRTHQAMRVFAEIGQIPQAARTTCCAGLQVAVKNDHLPWKELRPKILQRKTPVAESMNAGRPTQRE